MRQKTFRTKLGILAIAAGALLTGMFFISAFSPRLAFAFSGPSQAPSGGSGAIGSDSSNNVSIGTPTTISGTKLLVVGAGSGDTGSNALQILQNNRTPIFLLRDDGSVSISTSTVSAGNTVIGGNLTVGGTFTSSALSGSITAGNVTAGSFGSCCGGGSYSFAGNVGIGTASPADTLDVSGGTSQAIFHNGTNSFGVSLRGNYPTIAFNTYNNGTNDVYMGTGYAAQVFDVPTTGAIDFIQIASGSAGANLGANYVALTILNNGKVGIGTASPGYALDVTGDVNVSGQFRVNGTPFTGGGNQWTTSGNNIYNSNSGNVGIGTTGPTAKLDVVDGGGELKFQNVSEANLTVTGTNSSLILNSTNGSAPVIAIQNSGYTQGLITPNGSNGLAFSGGWVGPQMVLTAAGNVGIGTTSPGYTLDVNGNGNFSGGVNLDSGGYGGVGVFPGQYFQINWKSAWGPYLYSAGQLGFAINGHTTPDVTINGTGVGVGIAPSYTFDVNGAGNFNGNVVHNIGTPVANSDAATKNYVDTVVGGGGATGNFTALNVTGAWNISGAAAGGLNLNGYNITGVNTLAVTTIDPSYQIGGTNYETFSPSIAGVQDEVTGDGTLAKSGSDYEYAINFPKLAQGSDLWVWYQTVDFSKDTVEAIATPYGQFANIYYTIAGSTLTFHSNASAQFSFRLTGKRFDWQKWPTQSADQSETPGFILPIKN